MDYMENDELLIRDISARLAYGVKCPVFDWDDDIQEEVQVDATIHSINKDGYVSMSEIDYGFSISNIKPYLIPISSMTDEQEKEFESITNGDRMLYSDVFDFFNRNHIDYRMLIENGLAIDATNLNIY